MGIKMSDIFPELEWITDRSLKEKVEKTFWLGLEYGSLKLEDLKVMPYTASYETQISYQGHVRLVVKIAVSILEQCKEILGIEQDFLPRRDYLVAGALLHDVGKFSELELNDSGKIVKSEHGKLLRHAFSGVHFAMVSGLPDEVVHIIAVHSHEGIASHPTLLAHFVKLADQAAERISDWKLENARKGGED